MKNIKEHGLDRAKKVDELYDLQYQLNSLENELRRVLNERDYWRDRFCELMYGGGVKNIKLEKD